LEFKDILQKRYASRSYTSESIPEEKIETLLDLIRWTPSGLNIQPWRIRVVRELAVKQAIMAAAWSQPQVASCSHLLVLCADVDLERHLGKLGEAQARAGISEADRKWAIEHIKGIIGRLPGDKFAAFAENQVFLALATALYGAASLGIDACPMTGFDPAQVAKVLVLPAHVKPTALCPLGYGTDRPSIRVRFAKDDILI
jgi:nitroreductase